MDDLEVKPKPLVSSKPITGDDAFEQDEDMVLEDLLPKVPASMSIDHSKDGDVLVIKVPLFARQSDIRWSLKTDSRNGARRKHGLLVGIAQVPDNAVVRVTRGNGQVVELPCIGKTLAINVGMNPAKVRVISEAPLHSEAAHE